MSRPPRRSTVKPQDLIIEELLQRIGKLVELIPVLSKQSAKVTRAALAPVMGELSKALADLDPIKEPMSVFDPSDPDTIGRLVALALIAQPRVPMAEIGQSYGSGVYAIYYEGNHPVYRRLSGTETPLYVGKADPDIPGARTPREQGPRLFGRLKDHRRAITAAESHSVKTGRRHPLRVADFRCRRLVVTTNAQLVAEQCLIDLFQPIWNEDTRICWGISKHGDAAGTRVHDRSPWDVIHPGRLWAMDESLGDQKSVEEIIREINAHLDAEPPFTNMQEIVSRFLVKFVQAPQLGEPEDIESVGDEQERLPVLVEGE
jgi:hypothetical protein